MTTTVTTVAQHESALVPVPSAGIEALAALPVDAAWQNVILPILTPPPRD
jgi:hypothetical protein